MSKKSAQVEVSELLELLKKAGRQDLVDLLILLIEYQYKATRRSAIQSAITAVLIAAVTIMNIYLDSSMPYSLFVVILGTLCTLILGGISLAGFLLARKQKKLLNI